MLSTLRTLRPSSRLAFTQLRTAATQAQKRPGDISDAFASLSGHDFAPLSAEYADLKGRLIRGNEGAVRESWERLLRALQEEIPLIVERGSEIIPEIDFKDLDNAPESFSTAFKQRGVAVIRGVMQEQDVMQQKSALWEYIKANPQTKGRILCDYSIHLQCTDTVI